MITVLYITSTKSLSNEHLKQLSKHSPHDIPVRVKYFEYKMDDSISLVDLKNSLMGIDYVIINDHIPISLLHSIYETIQEFKVFIAYTENRKIGDHVFSYDLLGELEELKFIK